MPQPWRRARIQYSRSTPAPFYPTTKPSLFFEGRAVCPPRYAILLRGRSGHHFRVVAFAGMRLTLPSPGTANQRREEKITRTVGPASPRHSAPD